MGCIFTKNKQRAAEEAYTAHQVKQKLPEQPRSPRCTVDNPHNHNLTIALHFKNYRSSPWPFTEQYFTQQLSLDDNITNYHDINNPNISFHRSTTVHSSHRPLSPHSPRRPHSPHARHGECT